MINLSSIEATFPEVAFGLFRHWTKHQSCEIVIKNEQLLVENLRSAVVGAIKSLWEEEDNSKKIPGWSRGFFYGFVGSNLSSQWNHEYIVKNSELYKTFLALRAVENYLEFDQITRVRVDAIYSELLHSGSNLQNTTEAVPIQRLHPSKNMAIKPTGEEGKVIALINNQIMTLIKTISSSRSSTDLPVKAYFGVAEVELLLEENGVG